MADLRVISAAGVALAILTGCSGSPIDDSPAAEPFSQSPVDQIPDERLEAEPFTHSEKAEICSQVAGLANESSVLDGSPHLDVVEEDEWFCRIDGMDWITNPAGATIELGFYEYTDEELHALQEDTKEQGAPLGPCGLISFYEGDLTLSEVFSPVPHCEELTTLADTAYLVRNATAITVRLQLDGSPDKHDMSSLDGDARTLRDEIMQRLDDYAP